MKLFLAIIFVLLTAGFADAAVPSLVQQAVATDGIGGQALGTLPTLPIAGNTYIAIVTHASTTTTDSVTGDDGDTPLSLVTSSTVAGVTTEIWWANNIEGDAQPFTAILVGVGTISINLSEWGNIKTASAQAVNGNTGLASSTVTTGSVASTSNSSLVIAAGGWVDDDYLSGPINGFTRMTQTGSAAVFQEGAYLINSGGVAKSSGWTLTTGINWAAAIAVFGGTPATNAQASAGFFMHSS